MTRNRTSRLVATLALLSAALASGCASNPPLATRKMEYGAGAYTTLTMKPDTVGFGGELGVLAYPLPWAEAHMGATYFGPASDDTWFTGLTMGMRLESPTFVAPFVGVGLTTGYDLDAIRQEFQHFDYRRPTRGYMVAIYPEAGIHYWITENFRVTGSASYYVSSKGRDSDFPLLGLGLSAVATY